MTEASEPVDVKVQDFAAIELHDAILDELRWQQGSILTLVFGHIAVYFPIAVERYAVWSCHASLRLTRLTRLEVCGIITDQDWISDGEIWDQVGRKLNIASLKNERDVSRLEMTFANGATVTVHCSTAKFVDIKPLRQIEEWTGPLESA